MPPEAPPRRFVPSPVWLSVWLAVSLVAAKAVHWERPGAGDYGWAAWLWDVYVSTHTDVAFAAGFGLLAFVLLRLTRRWPRVQSVSGAAILGLGAVCAFYAVASIQIFAFLRSPLTYPLLYLAGDLGTMRSSLGSFLTAGIVAGMLVSTFGYPLAVWLSWRLGRGSGGRGRRLLPALLLLVAAVWIYHGATAVAGPWADRPDILIARSPHWEILSSVAGELRSGGAGPQMSDAFPPEFLTDFTPLPARGGALPAAEVRRTSLTARPGLAAGRRPRNVLLVVLESTGARYLSLYGSRYPTTPNLEAASANALVFDNFYSHVGLTANSLAAMSLSIYPYMTWREYTVEYPDFPGHTVAAVLKDQGYRTAFLSSSFLDYTGLDRFLANRGFDEVVDWKGLGGGEAMNSWGGSDSVLVDRTLDWIDRDPKRPFYGVVWTLQSHHPYDSTPGQPMVDFFAGSEPPPDDYDLGRYLNTIAEVDRQLGRLFAGLRERGLADDTVVIVTGDHGEAFGDPHPTWGHGFRLYQEGMRVPLMVWNPLLVPHGRRLATIGGHVDLNPTILDLLEVPAPESWEGRSLFAKGRPPRAYFYSANDDYLLGVREGDFKYVYNATQGREELFDLVRDPDEQRNVAASHPERCRVLRQRLAAWKSHAGRRLHEAKSQLAVRAAELR